MNLLGWDTVFVSSIDKINQMIQQVMKIKQVTFNYHSTRMDAGGTFGSWKISAGGSSDFINIKVPFQTGNISFGGQKINLAGVTPLIQLNLDLLENSLYKPTANLSFDYKSLANSTNSLNPRSVIVIDPDVTSKLPPIEAAIISSFLGECIEKNKELLAYIFTLFINPSPVKWLTPKSIAYTYLPGSSGKSGSLAVLGLTEVTNTSTLPKQVDHALLSGAYDFYYFVSSATYLRAIILPSLAKTYGNGTSINSFKMAKNSIQNNGNINTKSHKWGLITYHPVINDLQIEINNNAIVTNASGKYNITGLANAYVSFTIHTSNTSKFDATSKELTFEKDPNPMTSYSKHIPIYDSIAGVLGGPTMAIIVLAVMAEVTNSITSSTGVGINPTVGMSFAQLQVQEAGLSNGFYIYGT
jgi:hypothetical protein